MGTMGTVPGPDTATGTREPFFTWYKKKPIAWIGTGVTAAGFGLGIGGAIGMGVVSAKITEHSEVITKDTATYIGPDYDPTNKPCGEIDHPENDQGRYHEACEVIRVDLADYDRNKVITAVGWTVFGVGAIGTAIYTYIDWYSAKPKATTTTPETASIRPRVLAITPTVTSNYQGIGVIGTF